MSTVRRITFFVDRVEQGPSGWTVEGEVGLGPLSEGDMFSFVHHQDVDDDEPVAIRLDGIDGSVLSLSGSRDVQLRQGDILGAEFEQ